MENATSGVYTGQDCLSINMSTIRVLLSIIYLKRYNNPLLCGYLQFEKKRPTERLGPAIIPRKSPPTPPLYLRILSRNLHVHMQEYVQQDQRHWEIYCSRYLIPPGRYLCIQCSLHSAQPLKIWTKMHFIKQIHGCFIHFRIVHQTVGPAWMNHLTNCPL